MKVLTTSLEGVLVIEPQVFGDQRGFFMETYQQKRYSSLGINCHFVQDNFSRSCKNTLRGLHFQIYHPQAKLVQVISGEIFDVAVDIRSGSPTFGQWTAIYLSEINKRQLFIPEGFAHGFCVISESADVIYKCTDFYAPDDEGGILWSDTGLNIYWPITKPLLSTKDGEYPKLSDIPTEKLPLYEVKK